MSARERPKQSFESKTKHSQVKQPINTYKRGNPSTQGGSIQTLTAAPRSISTPIEKENAFAVHSDNLHSTREIERDAQDARNRSGTHRGSSIATALSLGKQSVGEAHLRSKWQCRRRRCTHTAARCHPHRAPHIGTTPRHGRRKKQQQQAAENASFSQHARTQAGKRVAGSHNAVPKMRPQLARRTSRLGGRTGADAGQR